MTMMYCFVRHPIYTWLSTTDCNLAPRGGKQLHHSPRYAFVQRLIGRRPRSSVGDANWHRVSRPAARRSTAAPRRAAKSPLMNTFCLSVPARSKCPLHALLLLLLLPFNGLFSRTTWVSRYQKGKSNLDFTGARDSEWQWHQLGHMQVCTSHQTDNHASTPPLCFLQAGCPSCRPTNSVKALKAL